MYIALAVLLAGLIGLVGGLLYGFPALIVTLPIAFALGWVGAELEGGQ